MWCKCSKTAVCLHLLLFSPSLCRWSSHLKTGCRKWKILTSSSAKQPIPSFLTSLPSLNGSVCIVSGLLDWIQRAAGVWQLEGVSRAVKLSTHDEPPVTEEPFATALFSVWGTVTPGRLRGHQVSSNVTQITSLSLGFALTRSLTSLCSCCAKLYQLVRHLRIDKMPSHPLNVTASIYIYIHTNELIRNGQCLHVATKGFFLNAEATAHYNKVTKLFVCSWSLASNLHLLLYYIWSYFLFHFFI